MAPPGAVPGDVVVGDVVEVGVVTVVVVELVVVVLLPSSVPHPVARGSTATPAIRPIQAECLRQDALDCGRMLVSAVDLMVMFASLSAVVAVFPEMETSNPQCLNGVVGVIDLAIVIPGTRLPGALIAFCVTPPLLSLLASVGGLRILRRAGQALLWHESGQPPAGAFSLDRQRGVSPLTQKRLGTSWR